MYKTSTGYELEFQPIPPMLIDRLQKRFAPPEPPTYSKMTAMKVLQISPHNETTLDVEDPEQTAANHKAWDEYQAKLREQLIAFNRAQFELTLLQGVKIEMTSESWVAQQERFGIEIPTDPIERKLHWLETVVIGTYEDIEQIMTGIGKASGATEEYLAQAKESFRRSLGFTAGAQTGGTGNGNGASVVLHPESGRSVRGVRDGQVHERVGRRKHRG